MWRTRCGGSRQGRRLSTPSLQVNGCANARPVVIASAAKQSISPFARLDGLLRCARNDGDGVASHNAVILRESGGSSTPRLLGSIIGVSGILGHPPSRVMTTECGLAISRHDVPEL